MKRIITVAVALITMSMVAGDFDLYEQVKDLGPITNDSQLSFMTDELWMQYADQVVAKQIADGSKPITCFGLTKAFGNLWSNYIRITTTNGNPNAIYDYANSLTNAGVYEKVYTDWQYGVMTIPRRKVALFENSFANVAFYRDRLDFVALYRKALSELMKTDAMLITTSTNSNCGIPFSVNLICVGASRGTPLTQDVLQSFIANASKQLVKPVRKYLRENGQSFITKENGENPVQSIIDEFVAGMNAKNHAGVKEFIAKIYPDYEWVDVLYSSDDKIEALKNEVYYGQKDLSPAISVKLLTGLGLDEYNKFIKEYNGDNQ